MIGLQWQGRRTELDHALKDSMGDTPGRSRPVPIPRGIGCQILDEAVGGTAPLEIAHEYAEALPLRPIGNIAACQGLQELHYLPRMTGDIHALRRDGDPCPAADKDLNADLRFQLPDGAGQAGLCNKKPSRRLCNGSVSATATI